MMHVQSSRWINSKRLILVMVIIPRPFRLLWVILFCVRGCCVVVEKRDPNAGLVVRVKGVYCNLRMKTAGDGWLNWTHGNDNINEKTVNRRKLEHNAQRLTKGWHNKTGRVYMETKGRTWLNWKHGVNDTGTLTFCLHLRLNRRWFL